MNVSQLLGEHEDVVHVRHLIGTEREVAQLRGFDELFGGENEWPEVVVGRLLGKSFVIKVESAEPCLIFSVSGDVAGFLVLSPNEIAVVEKAVLLWMAFFIPLLRRLTGEDRKKICERVAADARIAFDLEPLRLVCELIADGFHGALEIDGRHVVKSDHQNFESPLRVDFGSTSAFCVNFLLGDDGVNHFVDRLAVFKASDIHPLHLGMQHVLPVKWLTMIGSQDF